ncbi:P-loop containing nucleoside triphosphate hydrolase protein [Chytridium lagenaria]|nr:P-loop containing nucleoside triphosphate hydrolase protein [Chytridium lagenaria]
MERYPFVWPPGTGKTMLAKAVATECNTTFFNISASSIVSKWRGDSEKLVRVLFDLARHHAPSDGCFSKALMGHRTSDGAEHEGSRRMKTELLIQIDGLARTSDLVFLLAASNLPWDLDSAMLRRLDKRILIDLPDLAARRAIFEMNLPSYSYDDTGQLLVDSLDYDYLAIATEGYSGSDIKLVCKEAAMIPLRKILDRLDEMELGNIEPEVYLQIEQMVCLCPVNLFQMADLKKSLEKTRPSLNNIQTQKYHDWQKDFGSS